MGGRVHLPYSVGSEGCWEDLVASIQFDPLMSTCKPSVSVLRPTIVMEQAAITGLPCGKHKKNECDFFSILCSGTTALVSFMEGQMSDGLTGFLLN